MSPSSEKRRWFRVAARFCVRSSPSFQKWVRSRTSRLRLCITENVTLAGLRRRRKSFRLHVLSSMMNKQIAGKLGLSEIAVKIHSRVIMRKMGAHMVAELMRRAEGSGLFATAS
ncbi:LuxR C-terminal-related transcriptional regulator [Neomegalonema sp.]|uniref:LuxR C-terminal-related transcriptional regulator n=1 Tax=Neomegalonema sp. TaxID=2039713 RepID=UPI00345BF74A